LYHSVTTSLNHFGQVIERPPKFFKPLVIPPRLQADLPYASKPRNLAASKRTPYLAKRAVVLEPEEKRAIKVMEEMRVLRQEQLKTRKLKRREAKTKHAKTVDARDEKKGEKLRDAKKDNMRQVGKKQKREGERDGRGTKRQRTGSRK
jgi:ribosome biogenesis protein BMS1